MFALLVGVSFFARHLIGFWLTAGRYCPLAYDRALVASGKDAKFLHAPNYVLFDETTEYARFTQEVLRGELGGPDLTSYRSYVQSPLPQSPAWYRDRLGPAVIALLSWSLARNTPAAFALADFLLPTLLAAAVLVFCRQLRLALPFAIPGAALFLWLSWFDLLWLVLPFLAGRHNESMFLRTPNPQVSVTFFVLLLTAALRLHERPTWSSATLVSLTLALNFYTYFFAWTLGLILLVLALGWEWRRAAFPFLLSSVGAAITVAYPVWSVPLLTNLPIVDDSFWRLHGQLSRRPDLIHGLPALLLAAVSFVCHRRNWRNGWFWTLFWAASTISLNQQILTGRRIQAFHYVIYFLAPFGWIFLCDMVSWVRGSLGWGPLACLPASLGYAVLVATPILGFGLNLYRLAHSAWEARLQNTADDSLRELTGLLRQPSLRPYGFVTNDEYLNWFLPGFIPQKPLQPWYMDPLTNAEIRALDRAGFELSGFWRAEGIHTAFTDGPPPVRAPAPELSIRFDPAKVLLIANRHRPLAVKYSRCRPLLSNQDFLVFRVSECLPERPLP